MFPKSMTDHGHKLADDAIVTVRARVDAREDQPKLIAMEIEPFEPMTGEAFPLRVKVAAGGAVRGADRRPQAPARRAPRRLARAAPPGRAEGAAAARGVDGRRRARPPRRAPRAPRARPRSWPDTRTLTRGSRSLEQVVRGLSSGSRVAPERRIYWTRGVRTTSDPGAGKRMSIQVETKDCTALGDAELAELADLCAEGPLPVRGRGAVEAGRGVGARHPGPRERQAQGLLVLHARAHRRHPVGAHRPGVGQARLQARHRAAGDHARRAPPSRAGLPRRGRPHRHPLHHRRRLRGVQGPQRRRAPSRPQGERRGAGLGPAPGQALRGRHRPPTTTARSRPRATATCPRCSTTRA